MGARSSRRRHARDEPRASRPIDDTTPRQSSFLRWGWAVAVGAALLFYLPTVAFDFTYDDLALVRDNPRIRNLANPVEYLATSWWGEARPAREYRPLAMASFAVQYALSGARPGPYHLVNVILHGAITGLLWLLVLRVAGAHPLRLAWALAAALLFAIHPVHIEPVAGIVGRAELLAALGFMSSLVAALAGINASTRRSRIHWAMVVFLCSALAVFSKEHGVMLLPAMASLIFLPQETGSPNSAALARRFRASLPALAAALLAIVLYLVARRSVLGGLLMPVHAQIPLLDNPLVQFGPVERRIAALGIVARYAELLIAPFRQSPDYSFRALAPASGLADPLWVAGLILVLCGLGAVWLLRHRRLAWFGLVIMLLTFLTSSNLLVTIGTAMGERLLYLPSAGFCMLAASLFIGRKGKLPVILFSLWIAALGIQHVRYLPVWHDNDRLAAYMVRRVPGSARAQYAHALALRDRGEDEQAIEHLRRALRIYPQNPDFVAELGLLLARTGREDEALDHLARTHEASPERLDVTVSLVRLLTARGRTEAVERAFRRTAGATPEDPRPQMMYGIWLSERGRHEEAAELLEPLLAGAPEHERKQMLLPLARSHLARGHAGRARELIGQYLALAPDDPGGAAAQLLTRMNGPISPAPGSN